MTFSFVDVELQYEKVKGLRREDVAYLKEWLLRQPHLPQLRELDIMAFLQSCDFSIEMTKVTIDNYYTIKTFCREVFGPRDAEKVKTIVEHYQVVPLPEPTEEGYLILMSGLKNSNVGVYSFEDYGKAIDMVGRMTLYSRGVFNGVVIIFNTKNLTFGHLTKLNISLFRKYLVYLQEALPAQLKQIHVINTSSVIEKLLSIIRPFMKRELFDLIHVHSDYKATLFQHVRQALLPQDFGGSQRSTDDLHDEIATLVLENIDLIRVDEANLVDESKRLVRWTKSVGVFGVDGSFKQLELLD
ncbi:hypothetical protein PPYR_03095 [Photinus pyralis]|uniref:CRAL-TRIO domain-containing protein n=1 Tax=Photinus pyralis TaxID=7054 RepID=A0A5N4A1U4_PHOPY|nr:alpha-tocopherol transfer protein-like [Photinus pyralis]KAB0791295.1 hypothetical protein PPYR_03095 [Photinus pyralis]